MCSKILIIDQEKLVTFDTPEWLETQAASPGEIRIAADTDAVSVNVPLTDIPGEDTAGIAAAHQRAVENSITDGVISGASVTRQQLAALLYRFVKRNGQGFTSVWAAQMDCPDTGPVNEYAYETMCRMTMKSVINCTTERTLNLAGTATRARFAVMPYRLWTNLLREHIL